MISRALVQAGHSDETCCEVLQSTHDQPSEDVLYVVKHTLYAVIIKLCAQQRLGERKLCAVKAALCCENRSAEQTLCHRVEKLHTRERADMLCTETTENQLCIVVTCKCTKC